MKFLKNLIAATAVVFLACLPAEAQFQIYGGSRTIVIEPQLISATTSNSVVDIHGWEGTAKIDIITATNSGNSTLTLTVNNSSDQTNWTALKNYSLAVSNGVVLTNLYYGTGTPISTNAYLEPGTLTTPSASSSGFVTKYQLPAPFTNSAAITCSNSILQIGFNAADCQRYLQFLWTVTGGSSPTNTVGAVITGQKQQQ